MKGGLWLLLLVGAATTSSASNAAAACVNEARRAEQDATYLPDCRAYERVSPPGTTPYAAEGKTHGAQASASSNAIAWYTYYPPDLPGAGGQWYLSTRGESGWTTTSVVPPQSPGSQQWFDCQPSTYFSSDLSASVLSDGFESIGLAHGVQQYCGHNEPSLFSSAEWQRMEEVEHIQPEPEGRQNLFLRATATGAYQSINRTPLAETPENATFEAGSRDLSHVVFAENAKLTSNAPSGENLYEWTSGSLRLVTVLRNGQGVNGALVDGTKVDSSAVTGKGEAFGDPAMVTHAVSEDGERAFFTYEDKLYVRENVAEEPSAVNGKEECTEAGKACTAQIDASQAGASGGGGMFLWASADGSRAYFAAESAAKLTADTQTGSGANLYEYDVMTHTLRDLTPVAAPELFGVSGVGQDGEGHTSLYFVAGASLTGKQENSQHVVARVGQPNLYVIEGESPPRFIATLSASSDKTDWRSAGEESSFLTAQASPNGRYVAFDSTNSLTGYNNADATTGQPDSEIYLYDAGTGELSCVSCDQSSVRPTGPAKLESPELVLNGAGPGYMSRQVLNDGRVFFDSPDRLAQGDTDGTIDVYEYDDVAQYLISSGSSPYGSYFIDASGENPATGKEAEDVFFLTTQRLVGSDGGTSYKLYDAREDGGLAETAAARECDGEDCRTSTPGTAVFSAPASVAFTGPGDLQPPASKALTPKQIKADELAKALKACRSKPKSKRKRCESTARKRYGSKSKAKAKAKKSSRRAKRS